MATLKYSRQRESFREFLATRCDHPTADVVYENIRMTYPHISLGTVYRNLALLSDLGMIQKITTGDGKDHFDGNTMPHNHFTCKKCHCIIDLHMDNIDHIKDTAGKNFDGEIEGYVTIFNGTCKNCLSTPN